MRLQILVARLALLLMAACASAVAAQSSSPPSDGSEQRVESLRFYLAVPLDQQGKLSEALPLYRARAEQTRTSADRLRYAGALLRFGQIDEARAVYDELMSEKGSVEHGRDRVATNAGVIASSLLVNGFPALAVEFARRAYQAHPREPNYILLVVRALCASGDPDAGRALIAKVSGEANGWVIGQQIELARWQLNTGDAKSARKVLDGKISESVGQLFRDSILADTMLRSGDWPKASRTLEEATRKAPPTLSETKRVDRAWHNVQRELRSAHLRRAISLWKDGKRERVEAETLAAEMSDEEYVRSGAIVLQVALDLIEDRQAAAGAKLDALSGHDLRFTGPVAKLKAALAEHNDSGPAIAAFQSTLGNEDHSAELITTLLFQILTDASHPVTSPASKPPAAEATDRDPRPAPAPLAPS